MDAPSSVHLCCKGRRESWANSSNFHYHQASFLNTYLEALNLFYLKGKQFLQTHAIYWVFCLMETKMDTIAAFKAWTLWNTFQVWKRWAKWPLKQHLLYLMEFLEGMTLYTLTPSAYPK